MRPFGVNIPLLSSVVQSTELPSLSTERYLVFPLKASFALRFAQDDKLHLRSQILAPFFRFLLIHQVNGCFTILHGGEHLLLVRADSHQVKLRFLF